jgi:hypothetical protein
MNLKTRLEMTGNTETLWRCEGKLCWLRGKPDDWDPEQENEYDQMVRYEFGENKGQPVTRERGVGQVPVQCIDCRGSGWKAVGYRNPEGDPDEQPCLRCEGTGVVYR